MINHTVALDMRKRPGRIPPRLTMRRGESQTQKVTATLTDGGAAYTPAYQSARLCILHADGTWARVSASVGGASVTATLTSEALNGTGRCRLAYFEFCSSNGYSETTENIELVILGNVDGTTDPSKSYSDEMDALYKRMSAYQEAAETAEEKRMATEATRAANEAARVSAETTRAANEAARAKAEQKRHDEHVADQQPSEQAAAAANDAATKADTAANVAWEIANAAAADASASEEVAELRGQNAQLASMLADATSRFVFMGGTVYAPASKASYSGGTVTLGSTCSATGTTINLA